MEPEIVFNGERYSTVEAMPPDVRRAYERVIASLPDADRNGVPDGIGAAREIRVQTEQTYVVNGHTYHSPVEMPPDVRQAIEKALGPQGVGEADLPAGLPELAPPDLRPRRASKPQSHDAAVREGAALVKGVLAGALLTLVAVWLLLRALGRV